MTLAEDAPGGASDLPAEARPSLAPGVTLLGPYQGAGYEAERFLLRRADGRMLLVSQTVYAVAESIDGTRDVEAVATAVSARLGRRLDAASLGYLLATKLQPLGVVGAVDGGRAPGPVPPGPVLGVGLRMTLLPARVVAALGRLLSPLFAPVVVGLVVVTFAILDAWFFTRGGITASLVDVLGHPPALATTLALLLGAMVFHELGHAAGLQRGGGCPGRIGVGVYLFFPAFFTNVGDAYRLSRVGRLRTDLGGVYFNLVFAVVALADLVRRPSPVVTALVLLVQLGLVQQLLPLVRLDGYFVLSDLIGVPDLFGYVAPVLARLRRRNRAMASPQQALRRGARWLVGAWVALVVPALAGILAFLVLRAPLIARVSWREGRLEWAALVADLRLHHILEMGLTLFSLALLVLPFVGTALLLGRGGMLLVLKGTRAIRRLRRRTTTLPAS